MVDLGKAGMLEGSWRSKLSYIEIIARTTPGEVAGRRGRVVEWFMIRSGKTETKDRRRAAVVSYAGCRPHSTFGVSTCTSRRRATNICSLNFWLDK